MADYAAPKELYRFPDLLAGFDPDDPIGYTRTYDFQTFRQYVIDGGPSPLSLEVQRLQAGHDAHITDALRQFLSPRPRLVGFMGGHRLTRDEGAYGMVARLARQLTREGFLVVSGGGPGAMEATHLGAAFAPAPDGDLDKALQVLAGQPKLPNLNDILAADGSIPADREADVGKGHLWFKQALQAMTLAPKQPGASLAIPTWHYGNEPTCPFATHYAKYFQNSIREEALVTEARAGIIYARGGGGTVREIFQDVEQNYYAKSSADFTPMIFFDSDGFWQRGPEFDAEGIVTRPGIKLDHLLPCLFSYGRAGRPDRKQDKETWLRKLCFTTDFLEIERVLSEHAPRAQANLAYMLASEPTKVTLATWNRSMA